MSTLVSDSMTIVRRNLIKIKRVPDLLVFTTLQPIMFVLLFGFVFGALAPGDPRGYREFLLAGVFAQTVVFGGTFTGYGMAEDMQKGVIDRFRTLDKQYLDTAGRVVYLALLVVVLPQVRTPEAAMGALLAGNLVAVGWS